MRFPYRSITILGLLAVLATVLTVQRQSSLQAALPRPPAPPVSLPSPPSLPELFRQRDAAIEKRERLGRPVDPANVHFVQSRPEQAYQPRRDYSQQSCYHMAWRKDPAELTLCDATRCAFPNDGYCEHQSRDCYDADGKLVLNEQGGSESDYEEWLFLKWDLCLQADGSPVTPPGEKPFDQRIKTGCGYRVGKATPYFTKYLEGYRGYLMTCDAYRCLFHPAGSVYQREKKTLMENGEETLTPPYEYVPYLNWTCLNGQQANRVAAKYRCSIVVEDGENWGCQVCFTNGKHVYQGCKYRYNERGEIVAARIHISAALQDQLDELDFLRGALMERDQRTIAAKVADLEILFHQTPVADAAQEKIVALFKDFFNRQSVSAWTDAGLSRELTTLRNRIRGAIKK